MQQFQAQNIWWPTLLWSWCQQVFRKNCSGKKKTTCWGLNHDPRQQWRFRGNNTVESVNLFGWFISIPFKIKSNIEQEQDDELEAYNQLGDPQNLVQSF